MSFLWKVHQQVLSDQGRSLLDSLVASVTAEKAAIENVRYEKELSSICQRVTGVSTIFNDKMPLSLLSFLSLSIDRWNSSLVYE